jgi:hypothetical protein
VVSVDGPALPVAARRDAKAALLRARRGPLSAQAVLGTRRASGRASRRAERAGRTIDGILELADGGLRVTWIKAVG